MDRTITTEKYRFLENKHRHELLVDGEWKPLIGVTTALSVISKPALIQWASDMAVKYIQDVVSKTDNWNWSTLDWPKLFEEAKSAHRVKKEIAGQSGTDVHKEIENLVVGQISGNNGMFTGEEKSPIPQVQKFIDWAVENKVVFIESEKHVYSEKLWVGGILDLVLEMGGKRLIGDIKTSSGIYNEAFFQMGAYDLCLEEMGEKVDGYLVINLKKTGEFDLKIAENKEINRRAFLSALELHKIISSLG
jgi:hypothetical protein